MKNLKSGLIGAGSVFVAGFIFAVVAPKAAHAVTAGLVQVVNTSANPVPNRDQDNPAQQPFQFLAQPDTRGTGQNQVETDFNVPAGKRLVIEYVSAGIAAGTGRVTVETIAGGNLAAWYFLSQASPPSTRGFFPTTIYADPGTPVRIFVDGTNTQADVELSGHFVNIP
jgi:hypothetical protein